jgi:ferredoxin-NADP reductase
VNNLPLTRHTVLDIHKWNDTLFELVIDRREVTFEPGDYLAIYTKSGTSRPYSIASGIHEEVLRFLIRVMPEGEVSAQLANLITGDPLELSAPFGWFRPGAYREENAPVFFATGTGLSPFISYLRSYPNHPPEMLFYGARYEQELMHVSLLSKKNTRIAVSREKSSYHHGRITDLLSLAPLDQKKHYYCCGMESMIDEISAWLVAKNIPLTQIHREVFFHG